MKTFIALIVGLLLALKSTHADVIVSQDDTSGISYHFSEEGFAQTFTLPVNSNVSGIELNVKQSPFGAEDASVSIFEYDTIQKKMIPGVIATGTLKKEDLGAESSWIFVSFISSAMLRANTSYAFIVTENRNSSNQYDSSSSDSYPQGTAVFINQNGTLSERDFDFAFRIHDSLPAETIQIAHPTITFERVEGNPSVAARVELLVDYTRPGYYYSLLVSEDLSVPIDLWDDWGGEEGNGGILNWPITYGSLPDRQFYVIRVITIEN